MRAKIDRDCLFLLNDVARMMRTRADQVARCTMGMTRAQWTILARLELTPGLSQSELAALLEVEPITIARLVDKLEARELVRRCPDAKDRRIWRLELTAKANAILEQIEVHREEFRKVMLAGIDRLTLKALTAGLLQMKANLMVEPSTDDVLVRDAVGQQ
jgi:DNA-binding MarR family transcriptional regulator